MNKNFLPVFIILISISALLIWKFVPSAGEKVAVARSFTKKCTAFVRDINKRNAPVNFSEEEIKEIAAIKSQTDSVTDSRKKKSASLLTETIEDPDLPSLRNVDQVQAHNATWGVLKKITSIETLDGTSLGRVAGGRFFLIEDRKKIGSKLYLIGNFTPKKLDTSVRIPSKALFCFTGSPDNLSSLQRTCLREYFQYCGEKEEYRVKLIREIASKSPYFKKAADATVAFRKKAEEIKNATLENEDARQKATYELSQLRNEVVEFNRKHKQWKEANASGTPDPENDKTYLDMKAKCKSLLNRLQQSWH